MMRTKYFYSALLIMISLMSSLIGCTTAGEVVQVGPDTYSVTGKGEDSDMYEVAYGGAKGVDGQRMAKGSAYSMGMAKCESLQKSFVSLNGNGSAFRKDGFVQPFTYYFTLKFRCE